MPDSANDALTGMLAEGVKPEDVLASLESAGFGITPPEGDSSYEEEMPGAAGDMIEIMESDPDSPSDDEETEEEDSGDKRLDVAKKAMEKHGY